MNDQLTQGIMEGLEGFMEELYGGDFDEKDVTVNQRFQKIVRLKQLGIYVDEAHHLFGTDLKTSLSDATKETSLRYTINKIAQVLERNSTKLVACYNYTGTPYVENHVLPEVVYSYGLKTAIDAGYLKQVEIKGYDNVKNEEFLRRILKEFFDFYGDSLSEGLKPKIAIFGAEIKEVTDEIKPMVEGILSDLGIDLSTILVNVGDSTVTKDSDIQDFNNLDVVGTEGSKKQVILLVNKGREGWNCRSLFSVALFRSPKSKVFVLQATMRCLRSISETQQLAHVYLSNANYEILDQELKKNFNIDIRAVTTKPALAKKDYVIRIVEPVKQLSLKEIRKVYDLIPKNVDKIPMVFNPDSIDIEKYKSRVRIKKGIDDRNPEILREFVSEENRKYSKFSVAFEVARYLNIPPLQAERVLESSGKFDRIVEIVSLYNDVLPEIVIPAVFNHMFMLREKTETQSKTVPLIRYPSGADHFTFRALEKMVIKMNDPLVAHYAAKSFHTDMYCFDSEPEKVLFLKCLEAENVKEVYFTGMFTGSENGLSVQYIDPDSKLVRHYYPDILIYYNDGRIKIIEVKGDHQINSAVVEAKAFAAIGLAECSNMEYQIAPSTAVMNDTFPI